MMLVIGIVIGAITAWFLEWISVHPLYTLDRLRGENTELREENARLVQQLEDCQPKQDWIPIADGNESPEVGQDVLLSIDEQMAVADYLGGKRFHIEDFGAFEVDEADAWQPLPAPFKGPLSK